MVERDDAVYGARANLDELRDLCRISDDAESLVMVGAFDECVRKAPQSDMDVMGLRPGPDLDFVAAMVEATRSSCIFAGDSGDESALA